MSAPLVKTEEIVLLGDDRTTSEVCRLLSNLPPAVSALTGVDLSKVSNVFLVLKAHLLHSKHPHVALLLPKSNLLSGGAFYVRIFPSFLMLK